MSGKTAIGKITPVKIKCTCSGDKNSISRHARECKVHVEFMKRRRIERYR